MAKQSYVVMRADVPKGFGRDSYRETGRILSGLLPGIRAQLRRRRGKILFDLKTAVVADEGYGIE